MKKFLEKYHKIIIVIILAFVATVSLLNAWNDSAIFDETAHIPAGYSYLKEHDMRLNPEHPPLIKDLAALPLLFFRPVFDTSQDFWAKEVNGQWEAGRHFLFKSGNNADKIIFWTRVPIVMMSVLFGLFLFKWGKELGGVVAGMIALVLYAFDPNILGHDHFVTTDLGIALFISLAFYYFLKFIKEPTWKHVVWGGLFLGVVQLAKFSSVLIFPIFGLVLIIYPLVKINPHTNFKKNNFLRRIIDIIGVGVNRHKKDGDAIFKLRKLGEYLGKGMVAFALSMLVVWAVYYINTFAMPETKLAETINYYFSPTDTANVKNIYTNKILLALNQNGVLRPLSEYFLGVAMVFKRVAGGNGAYFMGQVSSQAFPAYFPVVFLIKEPLPSLFLMLFALSYALYKMGNTCVQSFRASFKRALHAFSHYLRVGITEIALFSFIILYSYISITGNLNIGFRHLFPILPFIYILVAKNIGEFIKKTKDHSQKFSFSLVISGLLAYLIIETILVYPSYMSYFNPMVGGPKKGYRYATDSNADWGQDLKRLKIFTKSYNDCFSLVGDSCGYGNTDCISPLSLSSIFTPNKCSAFRNIVNVTNINRIDKIHIDYFGGADIKYYMKDYYLQWWDSKRPIEPGWYAISTNFLQGSLYDKTKKDEDSYRWIKNFSPIHQIGTSILVYYIRKEDLGKLNR